MAHELLNNDAMFYVGQTPWHGLGEKLEIAPNTEEALQLAKLNWQGQKTETIINLSSTWRKVYHNTDYCRTYR